MRSTSSLRGSRASTASASASSPTTTRCSTGLSGTHSIEDKVHDQVADLRAELSASYGGNLRPLNAGLSFVLSFVTLGIYGLYVLYRMNRYWWDAQVLEQGFDDGLSQIWSKLGLMRYPITFSVDQGKRCSYGLYLILSIVTFGIWALVWDYKVHSDPDNIYPSFHSVEDTVLQTVRAY